MKQIRTIRIQIRKKRLGVRNTQEKLENECRAQSVSYYRSSVIEESFSTNVLTEHSALCITNNNMNVTYNFLYTICSLFSKAP